MSFSSGLMDGNTWLIVLTDKRVIFLDKGMIYGLKEKSIFLSMINSVSGQTGIIFGKIIITAGSGDTIIKNVWKKTVKNFTNSVHEAISSIRS